MSRARLFQRATNWLQKITSCKKEIQDRKEQNRGFRFAFGQLEERVVLNADFSFGSGVLDLTNYSSSGAEELTVSDTATHYEFALAEGTWNGFNSADVSGAGTSVLSLDKSAGSLTSIRSDSGGLNTVFASMDFTSNPGLALEVTAGDVTQTGMIDASNIGVSINSSGNVVLDDVLNNFESFSLVGAVSAEIADADDITLAQLDVTDSLSVAAGQTIFLNADTAADTVRLDAGEGVQQDAGVFIDSDELLVTGFGGFFLNGANRLGDSFGPGHLAVDVEGSFQLSNNFEVEFSTVEFTFADTSSVSFDGVELTAGLSNGDFAITTSADNVTQSQIVSVEGRTTLDVGNAQVSLTMANDFNDVEVVNSTTTEIVDANGTLIVRGVVASNQTLLKSSGLMNISGDVTSESQVFVESQGGVLQSVGSTISTREMVVFGSGVFEFEQTNSIQNLSAVGEIAVDVDGDFSISNAVELSVERISVSYDATAITEMAGIDLTGDLTVEISDADFSQASDAAVMVVGSSNFDLGTGNLILTFGDDDADSNNDNDLGSLGIEDASVVDLIVANDLTTDEIDVSDRMRLETVGMLLVDRDMEATNQILLVSQDGMSQTLGTSVSTPALMLMGTGDFSLNRVNSLGNSGTAGDLAAQIDGSLELNNGFGVNVASLTYVNLDTTSVEVVGVTVDNMVGTGDLSMEVSGFDITQNDDAPVIALGITTLDGGLTGNIDLKYSDTIDDGELTNENDFNSLIVNNGNVVEVNDRNALTLLGVFANNQVAITSDTDEIILDGNVNVGSLVKLEAENGVSQIDGIVSTTDLILMGSGYFDLTGPNQLGTPFLAGTFAADVAGDINLENQNAVNVSALGYLDLSGQASSAVGVSSTGVGTLNNFRLDANGIQLLQRVEARTVVFETSSGISQIDTSTTEGIIDATELSLKGTGLANLVEGNLIGSNFVSGDLAIDFNGDVRLKSLHGIDFDEVEFVNKDLTTQVDSGVSVAGLGGAQGNLELFAGGSITDASNIAINVDGRASLVADEGNGDVRLGETFSNTGGNNNITHFGSVGIWANDAELHEDSDMVLDGTLLSGSLDVSAFGSIRQSGDDPFSAVGTAAVQVAGDASFLLDSTTPPTDHLNDNVGRDLLFMANDNDELIDNIFAGLVEVSGTANTGQLNGQGTLRNVQFRNSIFEDAQIPTIDTSSDPLQSFGFWAPNSSVKIFDGIDVEGSLRIQAGVDADNGKIGGTLGLTNTLLNRKIIDASGTNIEVGGDAVFQAGNTIVLADKASDQLEVGGRLHVVTHGGDAGSKIRVGVAGGATRGTDSGATVLADQLRFRVKLTDASDSDHASFNIDNSIELIGSNLARSLMLVVDGDITDDADANLIIKQSTTLIANGDSDVMLGESFSTNFIDNNVNNYGTLSLKARNASLTEDSATLLDGVTVTGDLSITSKGHIRQTGEDRYGLIGTEFINVSGDATFTVDRELLSGDQLSDPIGQDVKLLANASGELMDNQFNGETVITTTDFDNTNNRRGSLRNVEFRNAIENANDPIFNLTAGDQIRNLTLWTPNSGLNLRNDMETAGFFRVYAGIDSANGLQRGKLQITDNSAVRNITDSAGVNLTVGTSLDLRVANRLQVADEATNSIVVNNQAAFITLGGLAENGIDVGTDLGAARGTDSGATFEAGTVRYRAPIAGNFGLVTIVGETPLSVTANSVAKSAVVLP